METWMLQGIKINQKGANQIVFSEVEGEEEWFLCKTIKTISENGFPFTFLF